MKKFLFISVPMNVSYFPTMALPLLVAQLKKNNYDATVMDLNIDFLHKIYTKSYMEDSILKAGIAYKKLEKEKQSYYKKHEGYINDLLTHKYDFLNEFFKNKSKIKDKLPSSIEKAVKILKDKELFYNPQLLQFADQIIHYANNVAFMSYLPYENLLVTPTYFDDLTKIIFDKELNPFYVYFEEQLTKIKTINPNYIGISINANNQLLAALTLSYLLKKETNAHINLGGDSCSRLLEYIPNYKDFFELFANSVSYGEGENSILELARYINGEIGISEVPQLLYKEETGNINKTAETKAVVLSQIPYPDYSDYDLDKYLLPEKVLPLQIQRGCYWNKCAFCDIAFSKTPSAKKIPDIINELKYYNEQYGVSIFNIIDEAVSPELLDSLSDAILKNNLDVKFSTHARFEKKYNLNLLDKMYKAGFRSIWWGLESANKRVQKLINKGIDLKNVLRILENSNKAGIMNTVSCVICFPQATFEEDFETYKYLKKHSDVIQSFLYYKYSLTKFSKVYKNPLEYKITIQDDICNSRIFLYYPFKKNEGMNEKEEEKIVEKFHQYYRHDKMNYFFSPDYNLLYHCKYGLNYIKERLVKKEKRKSFPLNLFRNF